MSELEQPPPVVRGRLLAVDQGDRYIGLALCDGLWLTTRPLLVLERSSKAEDFAAINAQIAKHQVVAVIVGLPTNPERADDEAEMPTRASTVRRWASRLAAAISVPLYLWEEQFSSIEAADLIAAQGSERPDRIDAHAAAVILQSFIDAHPLSVALPKPVKNI
ncbi:MAG: Holliday junction resolvase RuvX [Anaerolineae bacterium]|nr:Holliday junction resolvase RuvX [Anaerolineae bacterium]